MHGFEEVTLSWAGADYTVPASKQMMLVATVEHHLSLNPTTGEFDPPMQVLFRRGGVPPTRLAFTLGAALRYAGAKVTDDEIYLSIQEDLANKSGDEKVRQSHDIITSILSILSPPAARALAGGGDEADTGKKPQRAASSNRSTKRRSGKSG